MPDTTPVYGFTYPCPGETVDAADFQLLADQIDAAMNVVEADYDLALNRNNFDGSNVGVLTFPAGVATVAGGPQYTLPRDGVYVVTYQFLPITTPATTNAIRLRVQQATVSRFGFTSNTELNTPRQFVTSGVIVGTAGQVIRSEVLFSGSVSIDAFVNMSIRLICRIA